MVTIGNFENEVFTFFAKKDDTFERLIHDASCSGAVWNL